MPAPFNGSLRANEIFGAIYNMILSQEVFADNIKGTNSRLVDKAKVDAGLYGDTKLYYFTDVLKTHTWGDATQSNGYGLATEASNLLALDRPAAPFCQPVVIDTFKQIRLTVDDYLSKRAWADEYAFAQFNSVMLGWLSLTRKVYESTLYNSYIGGTESAVNGQTVTITPYTDANTDVISKEAENRLFAESVAEAVAKEFVVLTDINRVNDLAYMRSWDYSDLIVVWNAAIAEKLKRVDMPTIFHKEGLIEKFEEAVLPEKYFAVAPNTDMTVSTFIAGTDVIYAAKELDAVYGTSTAARTVHYFPGEQITQSVQALNSTSSINLVSIQGESDANAKTTFATTDYRKINTSHPTVCKIMHKNAVPWLSAFETGTSFFNPRSLTENHYLTFGHNTLNYLKGLPFITMKL